MTIIEAINKIDALKPNTYTQSEKVKWLSMLDSLIYKEIVSTHEGNLSFEGYNDDTPIDTVLIAEEPYDDMYIKWLESKIDYYNAEYTRYNNSVTVFNDIYQEFSRYYTRTHKPKTHKVKYFG